MMLKSRRPPDRRCRLADALAAYSGSNHIGWYAIMKRSVLVRLAMDEAITQGSSESGNDGTSAPSKPDISAARATSSM
jgi:hypothetical protein